MSKTSVVIADSGSGNLFSVARAFAYIGADVKITDNPRDLQDAERVVLPGVGTFGDGIHRLQRLGLDQAIKDYCFRERPMLGLCVGMQLLFEGGDEFGRHAGLGLIPGWVTRIPGTAISGEPLKVPHIGWSDLIIPESQPDVEHKGLFNGLRSQSSVYFVHSFAASGVDAKHVLAFCDFGGHHLTAAVQKDNIFGCQFHPERSGKVGLSILEAFLRL